MQAVADQLYLNSLRSKYTRKQYEYHLGKFAEHLHYNGEPQINEKTIIDYIMNMKQKELKYSTMNCAKAAIKHLCVMNDIILNWDKISKFLGERTNAELRPYTHEEIQRMLAVADIKYRAIILVLASTGMRAGALASLELDDMKYLDEYKIYMIRVYKGSKERYVTFTTPEAAEAVSLWLRNKDRIKDRRYFNRVDSHAISETLGSTATKAGIVEQHHLTEGSKGPGALRNEVPAAHGLRKFAITQMKRARVDTEIAKLLTGHSIGVRSSYVDLSDDDLLEEYLKAVDFLTINNENRLSRQIESLNSNTAELELLKKSICELREKLREQGLLAD